MPPTRRLAAIAKGMLRTRRGALSSRVTEPKSGSVTKSKAEARIIPDSIAGSKSNHMTGTIIIPSELSH
jgi:hypothetical protein